jgi:hypothetical protein
VQTGAPHTEGVPPPPHVWGDVQAVQVYVAPQPSLAEPQSATPPVPVQAVALGIGVQTGGPASIVMVPPSGSGMTDLEPHTLGSPAPPQVSPGGQVAPPSLGPQGIKLPQPSGMLPQFIGMPLAVTHAVLAVAGTHAAAPPHWFAVPPPPHVCVPVQVTHGAAIKPPQPSGCWPQRVATVGSEHVLGTHTGPPPQTLGVAPPPHDWPLLQTPH